MKLIARLRIRWKIFILCIVSIGVSSTILVLSLSSIMGKQAYNKVVDLSTVTVSQYAENFRRQLLAYQSNLQVLAEYKPLDRYMEIENPHEALDYYLYQLQPTIMNMFSRQYNRLRIYTNGIGYKYASEFQHSLKKERDKKWYRMIEDGQNQFWLDEAQPLGRYPNIASYYYAVRSTNGGIKFIAATYISSSVFDSLFSEEIPSNKHFFLLDREGNLLYSDKGISQEAALYCSQRLDEDEGSVVSVDGEEFILLSTDLGSGELNGIHWKMVCLVPYSDVLEERNQAVRTCMLITLLCVIITCLFSLELSSSISRKASNILKKINQLKAGNFDIEPPKAAGGDVGSNDELSILDRDFDYMAMRIHELINQVYRTELEAKEEQIKNQQLLVERTRSELFSLQRQIDPHYLFNTLEAIRMKLLLNGDSETAEIVELFGKSFRARAYYRGERIPLRDELEFVRDYITVCSFRFGGQMTLDVDVNDDDLDISIPKLMIQPLVENAITHGIESSPREDAMILLEIRTEGERIRIRVSDNGMGMTDERLEWVKKQIDQSKKEESPESIGLQNVSRRLNLMYGEDAEMNIESTLDIGTTVEMIFPIAEMKG